MTYQEELTEAMDDYDQARADEKVAQLPRAVVSTVVGGLLLHIEPVVDYQADRFCHEFQWLLSTGELDRD